MKSWRQSWDYDHSLSDARGRNLKGSMLNRRHVVFGLSASATAIGLATGAVTFRVNHAAKTTPKLTEHHLATLRNTNSTSHRVLFVGNSLVLGHDVPAQIEALAATDGYGLETATAAAGGAHLIESLRLSGLRALLDPDLWDAVVLQDFTKTSLRVFNRWGSSLAVRHIARQVRPTPVILYPPFPAAEKNHVYRQPGRMMATPTNPTDYARRTMAHYNAMAFDPQIHVAPVPNQWLADGRDALYADDGLHASAEGAALIARVLWSSLKDILPAPI